MDTPPSLTHRYGTGARLFHWTTALLVLAAFVLSTGGPEARVYAPERAASLAIHETLGLAVLVLTALRFAWRLVEAHPEPEPIAPWMRMASRLVEGCLLVLLIFVPLSAIAGAWLEGHGVSLVGVGLLGPWTDSAHETGAWLSELHTWLGDAIIWLAGLHAVAALYHHYIVRDRVLAAMLPWTPRPRS